jgi:hypothetical protein
MEKPKVVTDYNSGMEGVDLSDASYHSTRKRFKKTIKSTPVIGLISVV